jgi:hypothetical protein
VLHFCKLGQPRKTVNENEGSRPTKYSKSRDSALSFDTTHKLVHSINSDGCGPLKNREKNFRPLRLESKRRTYNPRRDYHHQEVIIQINAVVGAKTKTDLCIVCFTREIQTIGQGTAPSSWSPKRK